jgi:hypothetical protein
MPVKSITRLPSKERMQKALEVIEGLTLEFDPFCGPKINFSGHSMQEKKELIYKFAHVGLDRCNNPHYDWVQELNECHSNMKKKRVI